MMRRRPSGFTLVELLVAIAVMALLAIASWRGLDGATAVRGPGELWLGPEPLIGAQQVVIVSQNHPDRAVRVATDGLRPFSVQALP